MIKKKKHKTHYLNVEVVNVTTRKRKVINLSDERAIFDEKTGTYHILPLKSPIYDTNGADKEEKEEIL